MVRRILIGAMLVVAVAAAPAAAQYASLVVTPGDVLPGGEVSVSGQGCQPNETVSIYLVPGDETSDDDGGALPAVPPVATTTSDDDGNFTVTFTVPADTEPGVYTVIAACGDLVQSETINVLSDATPPTTTPGTTPGTSPGTTPGSGPGVSPGGSLPRTGSNLDGIGLVGAGLLAAGGLVLLATRRRRSASPSVA